MLAIAAVAVTAGACRKTRAECLDPPSKPRDVEDYDEQMARMTKEAARDPMLCRELASPRITLLGDELVLLGPKERRIARRAALPAGVIRRIDWLYHSLVAYRSQLREIRPTAAIGEVALSLDPALETPRAASIILTTVYGGYERAVVTTGALTFPITWYRRPPPDGRYIESILYVEAVSTTSTTVQMRGPVCARTAARTVDNTQLGEAIRGLCREHARTPRASEPPERQLTRCVDSVEVRALATSRFGEIASILRTIIEALADQKPSVDIALLIAGAEPEMMTPPSLWPGISMYAPAPDASGHCTLADGGDL